MSAPVRRRRIIPGALVGAALATVLISPGACRKSKMPARVDGAAVVVAQETTEEPGLSLADEVEPNDSLAAAQSLAPTQAQASAIAGNMVALPGGKSKDVDWYRITVPAPAVVAADPDGAAITLRQRLAVDVRPSAQLAISVDALDEQGKVLVAAAGTAPGEAEGVVNLAVTPGTYFVRVKSAPVTSAPPAPAAATTAAAPSAQPRTAPSGGGGTSPSRDGGRPSGFPSYRLTVRLLPFDPGDEIEPNGKGALAGEVTAGGDVAGYLGWRHDEDWFRLPLVGLPEGSVLSVDLDPPEGVAASILIADSVEHKLTEQRGRRGERVAIRNVRLSPAEPHMFVVVRGDSGRSLDERYNLRLRVEEAKADSELEPNDDPSHAVPIADGNFVGYLGPGDVDVYRYAAAAPVELDFEVTPPERVDLKIEILREDGGVLSKFDTGKRREPERLANLHVAAPVLLRLSAAKGDGNLDEPYHIRTVSRPAEAGAEREPNGTATLATPLPVGVAGTGLCFPRGDVDAWSVQPPDGAAGGMGILLRGVPGLTLEARVQTTAGKDLTKFRVTGEVTTPTRIAAPGTGCCLIIIREASGRGANPRDRYTLSTTP